MKTCMECDFYAHGKCYAAVAGIGVEVLSSRPACATFSEPRARETPATVESDEPVESDEHEVDILLDTYAHLKTSGKNAPATERGGRVFYDTFDFDTRFDWRDCKVYRLFCDGTYRPDKCNMDSVGCFPGGNRMIVTTMGVRIDMIGEAAEDALRTLMGACVLQLHRENKEYVHLPLAMLYPTSGVSHAPLLLRSVRHKTHEDPMGGVGPYRTHNEVPDDVVGTPLLPTVHGAIALEFEPGELDPLGRPSWMRGGFCRFAFIVPEVPIERGEHFRVDVMFHEGGYALLGKLHREGLLAGELTVYLGGVYERGLL